MGGVNGRGKCSMDLDLDLNLNLKVEQGCFRAEPPPGGSVHLLVPVHLLVNSP